MTVAHATQEPFSCLDAVRQANDELIASFPEHDFKWGENERCAAEARTGEFIARVVETGAVLDLPADRKLAQGFINYWAARPYTASVESGAPPPQLGRAKTLLKPFNADIMGSIVERSDALFLALSPKDQAIIRRIFLHLLRVSDGGSISLSPRVKTSLYPPEETKSGNEIFERFRAAGALAVGPNEQDSFVELRYDALVRHWPRLRDWIDERIKFREAALFWVRTGRDKGALISAKLAKSANEYGDLTDLEKDFVSKSLTHTFRRRLALAVGAALLILIPPPAALLAYKELYVPLQAPKKIAVARSRDEPIKNRVDAIRWLANVRHEKLDLSDVSLKVSNPEPINLKGLVAPRQWNFKTAELTNVDLGKAVLPAARFAESAITNSRFDDDAKLEDADFTRARISNTSFLKSTLSRAAFDGAQLCNVDFSEADVNETSFSGIRYDDLPNFKNTAWWLASGWTLQQVDALTKQFGGKSPDIPSFGKELNRFKKQLEDHRDPTTLEYVRGQDGIAWTYATYGLDLDKAETASRLAREGVTKLKGLTDSHMKLLQSYTADTLGYILLQKGQIEEALASFKDAAVIENNPGAVFRYALALSKDGREEEALKHLNSVIGTRYSPSYELYLLRDYFSGEFQTVVDEQQPKPGSPPASGWCH